MEVNSQKITGNGKEKASTNSSGSRRTYKVRVNIKDWCVYYHKHAGIVFYVGENGLYSQERIKELATLTTPIP